MPKAESEQEFKDRREASGGEYGTLPDEEYVFQILDYEAVTGVPNQYNKDGNSIRLKLKPVALADDEDAILLDDEGEELNPDKYILYFMQGTLERPRGLGFGPAGASRARRIISSALGQPAKGPLDFEWDQLLGGKFIASTVVGDNGYEKIETVRAHRAAKPTRARAPKPIIQAALDVFGDDVEDVNDPNGY